MNTMNTANYSSKQIEKIEKTLEELIKENALLKNAKIQTQKNYFLSKYEISKTIQTFLLFALINASVGMCVSYYFSPFIAAQKVMQATAQLAKPSLSAKIQSFTMNIAGKIVTLKGIESGTHLVNVGIRLLAKIRFGS